MLKRGLKLCLSLVNSFLGVGNEQLYRLMTLKYLTKLHLGNTENYAYTGRPAINFYEGVAPILETAGERLVKLVLENIPEVDVYAIGVKCPALIHLALSGITTYRRVEYPRQDLFLQLKSLELWCLRNAPPVCTSVLRQLLFPPTGLQRLLLQNLSHETFSDSFFFTLLLSNPLLQLSNAVFDQCDQITVALMWKLLEIPNQLRILRCWNCRLVTDGDQKSIKKAAHEENLTLYWEYYPYCEQPITHELGEYEHGAE
jgi:hypothetical protein